MLEAVKAVFPFLIGKVLTTVFKPLWQAKTLVSTQDHCITGKKVCQSIFKNGLKWGFLGYRDCIQSATDFFDLAYKTSNYKYRYKNKDIKIKIQYCFE